jgi:hypothetical protein
MKTGTCKLCKRERQELQDSHLMPQGMYKRIRSEKENNPHPILIDRTGSRPMSDQITDFVFCKECESRFDQFGENYALRMASFRERFRLQEELEAAVPAYNKNEFRAYATAQTPSIKRDELAYFALSVFWRASVHTWPPLSDGGKPVKIDLGETNNEALRRYLMKDTGMPSNLSMFFVACTDKTSQGSFLMPNLGRKENFIWNYSFMACGYLFNLSLAKQVPAGIISLCFLHSPSRWIFMRNAEGKTIEAMKYVISQQTQETRQKRLRELGYIQ